MKCLDSIRLAGLLTLCAASIFPSASYAVPVLRTSRSNATGVCQPELSIFETNIRKRPLAIQNEGVENVFISCTLTVENVPTFASLLVSSMDGASHLISCTGVTGIVGGSNLFVVKSKEIPGNGTALVIWTPADFGAVNSFPASPFSMSCLLRPGTSIGTAFVKYNEVLP